MIDAALSSDFPRVLRCGRWRIGTYKLCMMAGIFCGALIAAATAGHGVTRLGMTAAVLACAIAGLIGARLLHLILFAQHYRTAGWRHAWDTSSGGGSSFGGLAALLLISPAIAAILRVPLAVFLDHLAPAVVIGAFWMRFGCLCHGCCAGRETASRLGFRWHNHRGECKRRVPVQLLELAWLLAAAAGVVVWLPLPHPPGAVALGALAWYGACRCVLEPLREEPDLVAGSVRIHQVIAAVLALGAGGGLLLLW